MILWHWERIWNSLVIIICGFVGYGDLRISGGGSSGRLQFRLDDGTWGYVCSRGFDSDAARVACRQLGYASGTDYYRYRKVNNIV